jgi:uncharacterized membrane protein YfcA
MHEVIPSSLMLLAAVGLAAGFIDSIAGGGGLLSVPALLLAGLSPAEALGTNKTQSLFGSGSATWAYASNGHVGFRGLRLSFALSAFGAAAGALLATLVSAGFLKAFLPVLLIAIALYFALKPNVGDLPGRERMRPAIFAATIVPAIGFYDGILGPGTGSFFMLAYVTLAGLGVLRATAQTKLMNFASNIGAFAIFALSGVIYWKIGLAMGAGQFIGARLGAGMAMRNGATIIKPLLVTVCVALSAKLLFS